MDASRDPIIPAEVVLSLPEIRDYLAVNGELIRHLDQGCLSIRLAGAAGQRLLAAQVVGPWTATIEIDGDAGPELAAGMDAPGLTVVCRGSASDGGASGLKGGHVLVLGDAGPAFGYSQRGGLAVAVRDVAARAGLSQSGGDLILLGQAGPQAGERQSGGRLFVTEGRVGPHAGRGRRGGRLIRVTPTTLADQDGISSDEDHRVLRLARELLLPWSEAETLSRFPF